MASRNQTAIVEIFHGRTFEEMKWDRFPACHREYDRLEADPNFILPFTPAAVEATGTGYWSIVKVRRAGLDYITSPV